MTADRERKRDWTAGTRATAVFFGLATGIWYAARPPGSPAQDWPGTAAQIIATLLLALVFERAFTASSMRRRDAIAAFVTLVVSVVALAIAAITAATGEPFLPLTGAVVLGATVALAWTVLTDVLHELAVRSRGHAQSANDNDVWC